MWSKAPSHLVWSLHPKSHFNTKSEVHDLNPQTSFIIISYVNINVEIKKRNDDNSNIFLGPKKGSGKNPLQPHRED